MDANRRAQIDALYFRIVKSASTCDVAIIGGGIIGLSCAWRLAQRGAKVHLFERGQIGKEASWAAAGMLAAQVEAAVHPPKNESARAAFFDLCLQSRALYPSLAEELLDATGIDIELSLREYSRGDWRTPGIMYLATRENDDAMQDFSEQEKIGCEVRQIFPMIFDYLPRVVFAGLQEKGRAAWLPQEGQVENRKLVEALIRAVKQSGVEISQSLPVRKIQISGERIVEIQTSHDTFSCETVLLCAGAWSERIEGLPDECIPPVQPIAGQMLRLAPRECIRHVTYSSDVYLVPRRDKSLLVGATITNTGFRKRVRVSGVLDLLNAACKLVPELQSAALKDHWAGLRPATPDGLPIIGSTPMQDCFVATGHFRNGILLAPITAQLMADCILEGREPPREFALERFHGGVLAS